jgi:UDP-glucuronate 4-epimerase
VLEEEWMTRTILVTGGAGFIGSHVVARLVDQGDHVVIIDNFNDYYSPSVKRGHLADIARDSHTPESMTLIEGDVRNREVLEQVFKRFSFDAVIHLAAMAGVRESINQPQLYYDVNLSGTLALLQAARSCPGASFVLASTSSVYGHTTQIPFVETDPCDRPLAPYSASKRAAEILAATWNHLYGTSITVLRFFTVYGPRNRPDMMAYKILDSITSGREVPLFNGGQMERDWTYVADVAAGVIAAAERPQGYQILNIGRGHPVPLTEFVAEVERLAGKKANLVAAPAPDTDMTRTWADISRAREALDYNPSTSVHEGVAELWKWYREGSHETYNRERPG